MPTEIGCDRQAKHAVICSSVHRLKGSRDGLQDLLNEVGGTESPPLDEKKAMGEAAPTLLQFLDEESSMIDKISDDLNRIRDELHVALF